jgi:hypothetical protein
VIQEKNTFDDFLFDWGSSAWFLYLEAVKDKGSTYSVARFNVHIHSMKDLKVYWRRQEMMCGRGEN